MASAERTSRPRPGEVAPGVLGVPLFGEPQLHCRRRRARRRPTHRGCGDRGAPRGERELVRGDRDANYPERLGSAGGAPGVARGEPACDAFVDAGGFRLCGELRRPVRFAEAGDEHAARGRALRPIPRGRDLGRDAQQVAKLEVVRIDTVIAGAACAERDCDADGAPPRWPHHHEEPSYRARIDSNGPRRLAAGFAYTLALGEAAQVPSRRGDTCLTTRTDRPR